VGRTKEEVLAWEKRWALPAALVTFLSIAALVASAVVLSSIEGDGDAEVLRSIHEHSSSQLLAGILLGLGFALLAVPLFYLFRAVRARSDRVRNQLVGLVIIAPLFLGASIVLGGIAKDEGATEFVNGNAKSTLSVKQASKECTDQRKDEGAKSFEEEFEPKAGETPLAACQTQKIADDEASNAVSDASLSGAVGGFRFAGAFGLIVALFYTNLWALRTGVLGRFWGSLGMALGVAILIGFIPLAMVWFVFLGLLFLGWLPGGRPPAWAAGEAVPWPTPGEKAAAELEPEAPGKDPELEIGDTQSDGSERRKRKQRD
jgi:hypothetical protein